MKEVVNIRISDIHYIRQVVDREHEYIRFRPKKEGGFWGMDREEGYYALNSPRYEPIKDIPKNCFEKNFKIYYKPYAEFHLKLRGIIVVKYFDSPAAMTTFINSITVSEGNWLDI